MSRVDPVVVRVALIAIALLLAIPLALFLRSSNQPTVESDLPPVPAPTEGVPAEQAAGTPSASPTPTAEAPSAAADAAVAIDVRSQPATDEVPDAAVPAIEARPEATSAAEDSALTESMAAEPTATSTAGGGQIATAATVDESAEREVPDCSRTYTAGPGDSWYRIADEAGVTPKAILEQNRATVHTVIFPGTAICLPAGAAMPSPPTTAAPARNTPTTAAPTTAPATPAPTTTAPKATAPTTTTAPVPVSSPAEVQAMIREIWPDDLEERALEIAYRESKFRAAADNGWCCVGVFQLYWTAHRNWLDDYGIHSREQLKDARKNITAAYALYQRSGGWGPWGG